MEYCGLISCFWPNHNIFSNMYKFLEKQTPSTAKEAKPLRNGWESRQQGAQNEGQRGAKQKKEVEAQKLAETNPITPLSASSSGRSLQLRKDAASLNQPAPKRLKLKDYMHLASIQKKSKSKAPPHPSKLQAHPDTCPSLTSILDEYLPDAHSRKSQSAEVADATEIIKTDLLHKLQAEIRKLQDLCEFVSTDLKKKDNESETHQLLFNLHSDAAKSAQATEEMGQRMARYDPHSQARNARSGKKYYWREDRVALESPAKMLTMGLDMTFRLTEMLSRTPTDC